MASYQFLNHSNNNQVPNFYSGEVIHRRSKKLMCLHKILRIISSFPPPKTPKEPSLSALFDVLEPNTEILRGEDNKGLFDIDMNFRFGSQPPPPPLEAAQSESPAENGGPSACSCGIEKVVEIDSSAVSAGFSTAEEKSSVVECDLKEAMNLHERETPEIEDGVSVETAIEVTENGTIEVQATEINNNGVWVETTGEKIEVEEENNKLEERRSRGSLDLLIEAAKFISGEFEDHQAELKKPSRNREFSLEASSDDIRKVTQTETAADESVGSRSKRRKPKQCWMVDLYGDFDDVSPVVRSKRGRSQVLPYKYRDSILEPWKPLSRHKSATVPTKRRSR